MKRSLSLTTLGALAFGCVAQADDESNLEPTQQERSALVVVGSAWLTTPSPNNGGAIEELTCSDCSYNSRLGANSWSRLEPGEYRVVLSDLGPTADTGTAIHVTPYGSVPAECVVNPATTGRSGDDMQIGVSCTNARAEPTDTRFSLTYAARSSAAAIHGDLGFLTYRDGEVDGYYVTNLPKPTVTRSSTGRYAVRFAGLKQTAEGGNAQVTSWSKTKHCAVQGWGTSDVNGASVNVDCYDRFGARSDADFSVSYAQKNAMGAETEGYVWSGDSGNFGTYTPHDYWNLGIGGGSMKVTRKGPGRYVVNLYQTAGSGAGTLPRRFPVFGAMVSAWRSNAVCKILDMDSTMLDVQCTRNGNPSNSGFSVQVGQRASVFHSWSLVSGINFLEVMDAGYGVVCAQAAIQRDQVLCMQPGSGEQGALTPQVVGGGTFPSIVRSIAVDNADATATRVLVLGVDSVLRSTSGDLSLPVPSAGNFDEFFEIAQPIHLETGAFLNIQKVIVVRHPSEDNRVVGLTFDDQVVELHGSVWGPTVFDLPSEEGIKDITPSLEGVTFLMDSGSVFRSKRFQTIDKLLGLPRPNSLGQLLPLAVSGNYVISDANADRDGFVPCLEPADWRGFYNCGTGDYRFFVYNNLEWVNIPTTNPLPRTDREEALTQGNPMTAFPAILDLGLFDGSLGESFMAHHINARMYRRY